jgi:hypothetical protein
MYDRGRVECQGSRRGLGMTDYKPPELVVLGTLKDLTLAGGTFPADACEPSTDAAAPSLADPCPKP